jgi:ADP-heptose:LPS heptosyltransferase
MIDGDRRWQAGVHRLLAVRMDNIGDVVMLGPALRALSDAIPGVSITLLASPSGSLAAPMLPWVRDVIAHRALWQDTSSSAAPAPARELGLVENLRQRDFQAAVIFTSFSQSPYPPAYVCSLAGIPIRIGQSKEFGGGVLSTWVRSPQDDLHQAERNLYLLESVGIPVRNRDLELELSPGCRRSAKRLLEAEGIAPDAPFVALAPGASCNARTYPASRFLRLIPRLAAATGLPVVILGGERERKKLEMLRQVADSSRIAWLVGRTSLVEFAAIIGEARLVVANNSSALHFADAFARPMVILYSGTEYESQWRPRKAPSRLLRRPTACSPCYLFDCPYNLECLDIPLSEVVESALALLEEPEDSEAMARREESGVTPQEMKGTR